MSIKYYSSVTDKFYDTIDKAKADEDATKRSDKIKEVVKQIEDLELARQHEIAEETKKLNEIEDRLVVLMKNKEIIKDNIKNINDEADLEIQELKDSIYPCDEDSADDDENDDEDEFDDEDELDDEDYDRIKYYLDMINSMGKNTIKFNSSLKDILKYYDI